MGDGCSTTVCGDPRLYSSNIGLLVNVQVLLWFNYSNFYSGFSTKYFSQLYIINAESFASICYNHWLNKNRKVWGGSSVSAHKLINLAGQSLFF